MAILLFLSVLLTTTMAQADLGWVMWMRLCGSSDKTALSATCQDRWQFVGTLQAPRDCVQILNQGIDDTLEAFRRPGASGRVIEWQYSRGETAIGYVLTAAWPGKGYYPYQLMESVCLPGGVSPN